MVVKELSVMTLCTFISAAMRSPQVDNLMRSGDQSISHR